MRPSKKSADTGAHAGSCHNTRNARVPLIWDASRPYAPPGRLLLITDRSLHRRHDDAASSKGTQRNRMNHIKSDVQRNSLALSRSCEQLGLLQPPFGFLQDCIAWGGAAVPVAIEKRQRVAR